MSLTMATPNILSDPGFLFYAPLASTLPTMAAAGSSYDADAWPVAWLPWGATDAGSDFNYEMKVEPITVAELFDPVKYAPTEVATSIGFALADYTLGNLARAMNAPAGNVTTVSGTGATLSSKLSPPQPSQIVRRMIGWESLDHTVRLIGYQCLAAGQIQAQAKKAPEKSTIAVTFNFERPASGDSFNIWAAGVARLGTV